MQIAAWNNNRARDGSLRRSYGSKERMETNVVNNLKEGSLSIV